MAALSHSLWRRNEGGRQTAVAGFGVTELAALGWLGIGIAAEAGGAGQSVVEESLVAKELGRALVTPAVLFQQMAAHTACAADETELATSFASARTSAGAAIGMPDQQSSGRRNGYVLHAQQCSWYFALDGDHAALLQLADDARVSTCESTDPALAVQRIEGLEVRLSCSQSDGGGALRRRMFLLVAAMLSGLAEASRDLAVNYAKERTQFGKVIGSFQAVKHRCADMHLRARAAGAQAMLAAMADAAGMSDRAEQAHAALIVAVDAAIRNAEASIQIHGGLGFSEECIAHRFLKRAHLLRMLAGDDSQARARLALAVACANTAREGHP